MILDDQHALSLGRALRLLRWRRRAIPGVRQERQSDDELRAKARPVAGDPDGSALHLDEPLHERESEAQAALGAMRLLTGLHEHVEDARQELGAIPTPVSRTRDDRVRAPRTGSSPRCARPAGYFEGIVDHGWSAPVRAARGSPSSPRRLRLEGEAALTQALWPRDGRETLLGESLEIHGLPPQVHLARVRAGSRRADRRRGASAAGLAAVMIARSWTSRAIWRTRSG